MNLKFLTDGDTKEMTGSFGGTSSNIFGRSVGYRSSFASSVAIGFAVSFAVSFAISFARSLEQDVFLGAPWHNAVTVTSRIVKRCLSYEDTLHLKVNASVSLTRDAR